MRLLPTIALVASLAGCHPIGIKITPPPKSAEPTDEEIAAMVNALISVIFTGGMMRSEHEPGFHYVPGEGK